MPSYHSRRKTREKDDRENTKFQKTNTTSKHQPQCLKMLRRGPGSLTCPAPSNGIPCQFFSVHTWTITRVVAVQSLHGSFWNEPHDSYHKVDTAVVAYQV